MPIHRPPATTIYALIHPKKCCVFYVGATTGPLSKRLSGHISEAKTGKKRNERKSQIILEIIAGGMRPLIQELEVCQGYLQPMYAERFWIYQYKKVFRHPVTNGNIDLTRIKRPPKAYARNRVWW